MGSLTNLLLHLGKRELPQNPNEGTSLELLEENQPIQTYTELDSSGKIQTHTTSTIYPKLNSLQEIQNLSFNGTSNTYPAAKIHAAIKALQKLKIENILHLPSKAKRTYHPTENEIFVDT